MPNTKNDRSDSTDSRREGQSRGGSESGGNFKNDPERAAEAGKKGGQRSQGGKGSQGGRS